jgi:hypothetical protein
MKSEATLNWIDTSYGTFEDVPDNLMAALDLHIRYIRFYEPG